MHPMRDDESRYIDGLFMIFLKSFFAVLIMLISPLSFSVDHYGKTVSLVQVNAQNGCAYFQLDGVAQADPIIDGGRWFAISADNIYKKDVLSLLMVAYTTGATVKVTTTGKHACSYAQISNLRLE